MSTEKYNKEQIRNRMLKYAAAFWGIKKAENFDPVVKLLLEALSNEIYMLGEDFTPRLLPLEKLTAFSTE